MMLDLLPEAREDMEDALEDYGFKTEYPLTELLVCVGFFFMLIVEHLAHFCCSPRNVEPSNVAHAEQEHKQESCIDDSFIQPCGGIKNAGYDQPSDKSEYPRDKFTTTSTVTNNKSVAFISHGDKKSGYAKTESTIAQSATIDTMETTTKDTNHSTIRGIGLMIALSIHMLFDGLAIGMLTEASDVWQLLIAIATHKCLVFFTIGLQSVEMLSSAKKAACVVLYFAVVSPLGVLVGEAIHTSDDATGRDTVTAVLQGIATGTFLFVTFFEILLRELGSHKATLLKIVFSFVGFVCMACVRLLAG
ncbi:hypothetical protein DPMN_022783 [Dreissena polymorpha]|uniref:Uncharacterized protein n=2 Tax=Dreissena polymorpha TaxID=45954 RepID=A0A9D4NKX6_DREPO|nr:hypothetical protein DPMN_022783 [Dreissena polymorpha]